MFSSDNIAFFMLNASFLTCSSEEFIMLLKWKLALISFENQNCPIPKGSLIFNASPFRAGETRH